MSKFGELIDLEVPVMLNFYKESDDKSKTIGPLLNNVAAELGDKAKIVKIDVDKNKKLAEALHIDDLPALVIYKDGEMVWRKSGHQEVKSIVAALEKYS